LNLSKEIQLDALEMVRRAERGVGLAIRKGQAGDRLVCHRSIVVGRRSVPLLLAVVLSPGAATVPSASSNPRSHD